MLGKGEGKTKKQSEQEAAKQALHELQQTGVAGRQKLIRILFNLQFRVPARTDAPSYH